LNHAQESVSDMVSRRTYNVLMIAPTSFFADYGCHVRILEEARVLQKMGNRVTICTYYMGRDMPGLDIRRTMPIPWRTRYEVGSSRHKIAFDTLLSAQSLLVALQTRPDIVHGHLHEGALIGSVVSKLLNAPLVFDFQGSLTAEMIDHRFLKPHGQWYRFLRELEETIAGLPLAIITSSRHAADLLRDEFHCAPERISTISDCVNSDSFAPGQPQEALAALRASLGIPAERQVVVYLGLLAEWQGTGLLLDAAKQVLARRADVQFLIMGYPAVEAYRSQALAMGLDSHVVFTGKIPYEQVPSFLALGDVAVAPKISATEGSGKLANYMSMGLPTVAFDVPVSHEYLHDSGIYARPGDATSLAESLEKVLADPELARELGRNLRRRAVEQYSWTTAGARIMDVYDRIARNQDN
jgi:glycosyltransferase involved in cell wall biosynthesis